ncbi:tyrosine-protein phosphatase [Amycolatopsis acidicola]|uniref:Tyrosine-protein phosphatase n=1 Tax=Amycolatopsis acidicola TaxID=2596893 RepID=A0A5N0URL4_9PSEU|nr:tyrosine-protein phosphatase [Amycolatopsis acidicola]KAA9154301.1 tyrosine-protein phosphatase [Amycolatopsis acidicola]
MTTVDSPRPGRHLPLAGTHNVRDVGGYRTRDGGTIRWQTLLRADGLSRLDAEGQARLAGIGLRTVIDLREQEERDGAPEPFTGEVPVLRWFPVFDGNMPADGGLELARVYERMVDECGARLTAAVRALAEPDALPALVHCTAGKDRTGVVIALALSVAGVAHEDIAADYALTSVHLGGAFLEEVRRKYAGLGLPQGFDELVIACPPELILATLDRVTTAHGSVENFLLAHGATTEELAALRTALVEPVEAKGKRT